MICLNEKTYHDKVMACWIGKNIGGTLGTPFEGKRQLNQITGFTSPKGEPLPNDDLDLQLVWLLAGEEQGLQNINPSVLSAYWLEYIVPHWNEYGIGKANLRAGLLPPLSGHYRNPWKDSNGAWIRTEIWASLAPADPDQAVRWAFADACVDHGLGEGTWAALFTAAVESAAFVIEDLRTLLNIGLSKIPPTCRVARSVNLAIQAYDTGKNWQEAREIVMADSRPDLGWFQAPANVAFAVIGLLYGEGDYKKSLLIAVNCGDDTDCTGATVGALLGIMHGKAFMPQDWIDYIGDRLITISLNRTLAAVPATCTELTQRVTALAQRWSGRGKTSIVPSATELPENSAREFMGDEFARELQSLSPYAYAVDTPIGHILLEYDQEPILAPDETISIQITITNRTRAPQQYQLRWFLPVGWAVAGPQSLTTFADKSRACSSGEAKEIAPWDKTAIGRFTVTAGTDTAPLTRLVAEISCPGLPQVGYLPVVLLH
ncbi:MAG: ADP-ribosylglycohydrolase family protein [Oscillospiraceae bacterium]|nr:ADP-ribosylglycohydrolase family protein [Oscillospiraceae bacterium]